MRVCISFWRVCGRGDRKESDYIKMSNKNNFEKRRGAEDVSDFKEMSKGSELTPQDISAYVDAFAVSFRGYPLFEYFLNNKYSIKKMKAFWTVSLRTILDSARFASANKEHSSLAILLPTKNSGVPIRKYVRSGGIGMACRIGIRTLYRMLSFENFATKIKNKYASPECWYLYAFVTAPESRGQGLGSKTLHTMIDFLDKRQADCYLETLTAVNVGIYQKYGFELKETVSIPKTDLTLYAMHRPARKERII